MKTQTDTHSGTARMASDSPNPTTRQATLLAIRLQDVNRIKSYLLQCGMVANDQNIAMQHCKEILAQFSDARITPIYRRLDEVIGFSNKATSNI